MWAIFYKNLAFLCSMLGNYSPFIFLFRQFRNRYPHYAIADADVCIEAYPRSGNTFLVALVQMWNPKLKITHHSHLASNIKYSLKRGIPVAVLIRPPLDAVASAMVWDGKIRAWVGLLGYISFYSSLRLLYSKVTLLDFVMFTSDPVGALREINANTADLLEVTEYNEREEAAVRAYLAKHDERNKRDDNSSSLPNKARAEQTTASEQKVAGSILNPKALTLYRSLTSAPP